VLIVAFDAVVVDRDKSEEKKSESKKCHGFSIDFFCITYRLSIKKTVLHFKVFSYSCTIKKT